ncbi:hypothetical protein [Sphingobium sp. WCS2017Hpa-17]|uniref:hypothetical protein n=1 Tax=Sphingobium sp. WCS2017Hpa-17 TaxID=3073638 RepID=UPI002889732B|nr:hypothetical protein [Sphingobium sp. WCS2017Hpa-17]
MVPKSGTRVPKLPFSLSDAEFAEMIAEALQQELGGSRRASKTIMAWTGVTDHTARAWLNGRKSPSSAHLLGLAANCPPVMVLLLRLTGHDRISIDIELIELEAELERMLAIVQTIQSERER